MLITVVVLALGLLATVAIIAMPHRNTTTGRLSRTTPRQDHQAAAEQPQPRAPASTSEHDEARTRAEQALVPQAVQPATHEVTPPARRAPDDEALGVTRRQFFNRSILFGIGLGVTTFGASTIAFLWPAAAKGGFGGKINVGSTSDAQTQFTKKEPFYNAAAKTYMVPYPKEDIPKAEKIAAYTAPIIAGMRAEYVALYQRCVHLGCRVPWCDSSQWFECPCHGSKYNRVGEKQGGPAPRGLDRFVFEIAAGNIIVDTGNLVLGPPIGTNTTSQAAEGPPCV